MSPGYSRNKLKRSFYTRDVLTVAKELLGKILVKRDESGILAGIIVETEAYDGDTDQAAHTYTGKTKRNEVMFGPGGFFYVYFTYGVHYCCNVVTGVEGKGTAVLIRAVEPVEGISRMAVNRFGRDLLNDKEKYNLTSGPGKVCQAFSIDKKYYGEDLTGGSIYILNRPPIDSSYIKSGRRIGIRKSTELPWRFYINDNLFVSKG